MHCSSAKNAARRLSPLLSHLPAARSACIFLHSAFLCPFFLQYLHSPSNLPACFSSLFLPLPPFWPLPLTPLPPLPLSSCLLPQPPCRAADVHCVDLHCVWICPRSARPAAVDDLVTQRLVCSQPTDAQIDVLLQSLVCRASAHDSVLYGIADEIAGLLLILGDVVREELNLQCQIRLVMITKIVASTMIATSLRICVFPKRLAPHCCTKAIWIIPYNLMSLVVEHHHNRAVHLRAQ